jgi:quinol monooxygenase YgiN
LHDHSEPGDPVKQQAEVVGGHATDGCAGVVRISTFRARPGQVSGLIDAAGGNADAARQAPGCLSAEVCTDPDEPDTVLVISRWESESAVRAFLDWHERLAHGTVSPYAVGKPRSVHYPARR